MKNLSFLIAKIVILSCANSWAVRFEIKDAGHRNLFYLVSDAPMEKILGQSNAVDGWLELNPQKIREGIRGQFTSDLRTIETGTEGRNELFRDKMLQASEFPVVTYEFNKVLNTTSDILKKEQIVVMKVEGTLRLRGQTRSQSVFLRVSYLPESEATKTRLPGNLLKVATTFDVDLMDFGFQLPEPMAARVARIIQVSVDGMGTDINGTTLVLPIPEGPKPKESRTGFRNRMPSSEEEPQ